MLKKRVIHIGIDVAQMTDRGDAANGEACLAAHAFGIGAAQRFAEVFGCCAQIKFMCAADQHEFERACVPALEQQGFDDLADMTVQSICSSLGCARAGG